MGLDNWVMKDISGVSWCNYWYRMSSCLLWRTNEPFSVHLFTV